MVNSGTVTSTAQTSTIAESRPIDIAMANRSRCGATYDRIRRLVAFDEASRRFMATMPRLSATFRSRKIVAAERVFEDCPDLWHASRVDAHMGGAPPRFQEGAQDGERQTFVMRVRSVVERHG